jgi:hypothetical protein
MNRPLVLTDSTGLQSGRKLGRSQQEASAYTAKVNSVKIFTGTFPQGTKNPNIVGKPSVTQTGTAAEAPSGAYISVNYTLQNSAKDPVSGVQIYEEFSARSTSIASGKNGVLEEEVTEGKGGGRVAANPTSSDGTFTDEPLGGSSDGTLTSFEITQTLFVLKDGQRQDLVTNKLKVTMDHQIDKENNRVAGSGKTTIVFSNPDHLTELQELPLKRREK